jgi:hypothetical protein
MTIVTANQWQFASLGNQPQRTPGLLLGGCGQEKAIIRVTGGIEQLNGPRGRTFDRILGSTPGICEQENEK